MEEEWTQDLSIYTPRSVCADQGTQLQSPQHQRDSLNLLIFHDDSTFLLNYTTRSLECKGVKIVHLPSIYDAKSVVPFLLLNDHSILLVQNPKKDVLPILKSIMRSGVIWYKAAGESTAVPAKPIRVNITIWVFIDILPWLEKLNKVTKKNAHAPPKKVKEVFE